MEGSAIDVLLAMAITFIVTVALAGGLAGYMFGNLNILWRILLLAGAALMVHPAQFTTIIGGAIIVAFLRVKFLTSRLSAKPRAPDAEESK